MSFIMLLSGCDSMNYPLTYGRHQMWTPEPMGMSGLPDGDDSYSQGFRDGCNVSLGIVGSGMLRAHGFAYDVNRGIEDRKYYRGYRLGNNYCMYYVDRDPL